MLSRYLCSKKNIVYTDTKNRQVKEYNPEKNTVTVVSGPAQEKNSDRSEKSASFVQVHAICTYEKSLFVTNVAVGTTRLVNSLSKTVAFLKNLGCHYDTFGTHEKGNTEGGERERRQSL